MSEKEEHTTEQPQSTQDLESACDTAKVIDLISQMLMQRKMPDEAQIDESLLRDPAFSKLYDYIIDLRELSAALNRGDLHHFVYGKGYVLSGLKGLQSNLRHLTWQTQMIAQGDFSQRVDFLGEFSRSFNEMVVKLERMTEQLRRLASFDALTNAPNRLSLEQFFEAAFFRAKENGLPLSALLFDIDHFKQVNDTYGHPNGDRVLIQVSDILSAQFRFSDICARFGGEEFIAVLPNTDLEHAIQIADRSRRAVEASRISMCMEDGEENVSVTVSIGASEIHPDDADYQAIIDRIDQALYMAKNGGRNRVCST